jgi:hypothetical protein
MHTENNQDAVKGSVPSGFDLDARRHGGLTKRFWKKSDDRL